MFQDADGYKYYQTIDVDDLEDTFESSVDEFTEYYRICSRYDMQEKLVHMYFIKYGKQVVGYVTIAMAHLRPDATEEIRDKDILNNVPALLISHLAVHKDTQRRGIGTKLLDFVINIVPIVESLVGCRHVMLNPVNDPGVINFYKKYGFKYDPSFSDGDHSGVCLIDLKSKRWRRLPDTVLVDSLCRMVGDIATDN